MVSNYETPDNLVRLNITIHHRTRETAFFLPVDAPVVCLLRNEQEEALAFGIFVSQKLR